MRKESSESERKIIINLKLQGKTLEQISSVVNRPISTIHDVIRRYKINGNIKNRPRCGRPECVSEATKRKIVREVKKNPRSSAVKIAAEIQASKNKPVSATTVRRILNSHGLHGRTPRVKPLISKVNRKKRLLFAKKYKNMGFEFWRNVLFSDECKFVLKSGNKQKKIWREVNKELDPANVEHSIKHGGGSVMVWGCMAASGSGNLAFIESTMNAHGYLQILRENVKPSAQKLGLQGPWYLQQDNDPKHTSYIAKQWIAFNTPKLLDHPPQSPDLNPIEHLWDHLKRNIKKYEIQNVQELKTVLNSEWQKIDNCFTRKLVESMPKRLQAVIKAKGYFTKY